MYSIMPQDYFRKNFRGRSFKDENVDLKGANFSGADIRGVNFTGQDLNGANFRDAKAGLLKHWAIFLLFILCLLSGVLGFLSAFAGVLPAYIFDTSNLENQVSGGTALIIIIVVVLVIFSKGLNSSVTFAIAGAFAVAAVLAAAGVGAGALAGAGSGVFAVAVALALAGVFAGAFAVAGSFSKNVTRSAITFVGAEALVGAFCFAKVFARTEGFAKAGAFAVTVAVPVAVGFVIVFAIFEVLLSAFIAFQTMKKDGKYAFIRNIAIAFAAMGGTSFYEANLTDADFTEATLKSTDFRKANLTRTCFRKTKKLDFVRPGTTYLQKAEVVSVLVTGQGQKKIFDREDLRGVNFQGANLVKASFIGADLSQVNLQGADLSQANLVQTQLDRTDFGDATLTGATIEDWGITRHTKLRQVKCKYVFMRLVEEDDLDQNRCRKPDNWKENFEEDEDFADFIKPITDTLDLYHNRNVDPRAITIAFKQISENNPEAELRIVAMEVRGEDKFLVRVETAPTANKSELMDQYSTIYNQLRNLPEQEMRVLLAASGVYILRLEDTLKTIMEYPRFLSTTQIETTNTMIDNSNKSFQNVSESNVYGGLQASQGSDNQQTMKSNVVASGEKQLTPEDVVRMLVQIEQLIEATSELPETVKEKSLKYLGAAKEEAQATEPDKQLASGNLKRMAQTLKTASDSVASTKNLWEDVKPILLELPGWLGVAKSFFGF